MGNRIGFKVENGLYRGTQKKNNYDGLWQTPDSTYILIEVKTTDAYRIKLDTIASYRKALISEEKYRNDEISILVVVGRTDTGDLEAQVRGSRHAWTIRIISVGALINLMRVKEELDNPDTANKIFQVLFPKEYTKLDEIIDMIFSTAEGITEEVILDDLEDESDGETKKIPVSFREECIEFIQKHLEIDLVKRTKTGYSSTDNNIGITTAISREYIKNDKAGYWFAFHPNQKKFLDKYTKSFVAFGCGSPNNIILFPSHVFYTWLEKMNKTNDNKRFYWHVHIGQQNGKYTLELKRGHKNQDITEYRIKKTKISK